MKTITNTLNKLVQSVENVLSKLCALMFDNCRGYITVRLFGKVIYRNYEE